MSTFDKRELGTILAALRYWQREALSGAAEPLRELAIAEDHGGEKLTAEEVDALCERINMGSEPPGDAVDAAIAAARVGLHAVESIIRRYDNAISEHIWDPDDPEQWEGDDRKEADALVLEARAELAAIQKPITVLVGIEGGLVQGASTDSLIPITVLSADYDTDGADADEISSFQCPVKVHDIPASDTWEAVVVDHEAHHDPEFINNVLAALKS